MCTFNIVIYNGGKMKHVVHVNQSVIRSNIKHGSTEPVLTCKSYKDNQYGHEVVLTDKTTGDVLGKFIYSPNKPLSCGARVWFEFDDNVVNFEVVNKEK
ncbi:hypothetical protein S14_181 [Shewanella sp. phage 1/4]|uniref:hypothetical protein n=1 Tax=Shewanella phage 1/4 TaxID=1458859 RepID=UPI0004F795A7|nr:hypothetical protein S14_181 [Shewanella sp. phage 1/4]AHK11290.1 hypothetical protein S14_181 [Shewanella sp. phage 1/4]